MKKVIGFVVGIFAGGASIVLLAYIFNSIFGVIKIN